MLEERQPRKEIELKYPGFSRIIKNVVRVLESKVKPLRSDFAQALPPILLCDREKLQKIVGEATAESPVEKNVERAVAHFAPIECCIYAESQTVQEKLKEGRTGKFLLTLIFAEEYLHGLTTFYSAESIRTAFLQIPYSSLPLNYLPGQIAEYDLDIDSMRRGMEKYGLFVEDETEIRLTENITKFALHLMSDSFLKDLGYPSYPRIFLLAPGQKGDAFGVVKSESLLRDVLETLIYGDTQRLAKHFNGRILQALNTPDVDIASVKEDFIKNPSNDMLVW